MISLKKFSGHILSSPNNWENIAIQTLNSYNFIKNRISPVNVILYSRCSSLIRTYTIVYEYLTDLNIGEKIF